MLARFRSLVRSLFRRARMEQDMADEFGFHSERRVEDLIQAGVPPTEAARQARLEFGAREAYKDDCRQARGLRFFDECGQDLRYGFRTLRSNPGFAAVAILSLALGIGANTAIFSLLDAALLKSLPVARPDELLVLNSDGAFFHGGGRTFSYPMFQRFRAAAPAAHTLLAMSRTAPLNTLAPGERESVGATGQLVSGEYFATLGVYPELGQLLTPEDNRILDGHPVAVISHGFWQRRFGGSPAVLGRQIQLNGTSFTIVGVVARSFSGVWVDSPVDVWLPLVMQHTVRYAQHYSANNAQADRPWTPQDGVDWLDVIFRANSEQSSRLRAVLNATFQQNVAERAQRIAGAEERRLFLDQHLTFRPFGHGFSNLRREFAAPLWALMAMVAVVLLIACANIANLLLARSAARQREIAVRLSIGASRTRLIRQLLTESTLVAVLGGVAGIATAHWASAFLVRMALGGRAGAVPPAFALDLRVLGFAAALSIATGILFGLAPAFRTTKVQLSDALKAGSRSIFGGSSVGGMRPLVALQVALSLAMLVGAGLFGRSLRNLIQLDPGFDREHLVSVWIDPQIAGYPRDRLPGLYQRLIERIEAVAGVRSASISSCGLVSGCRSFMDGIEISGYQRRPGEQVLLQSNWVGPKYFSTVGMPLLAGRELDVRDSEKAPKVAVINEAMARRYFANRNPLGERFGYPKEWAAIVDDAKTEIVGVVRDARVTSVRDAAVPMAYYARQQSMDYSNNIDVRAVGDPRWIVGEVRKAVHEVDPSLPVNRVSTMTEQISDSVNMERLVAYLTSAFGILSLVLASVGLYGVMSYAVSRRTSELGIRMALGAYPSQVLWMVLRESLVLVALGVACGLPLVFAASRFLKGMLFGLAPGDSTTVLSAILILVAVAAIASYLPALRASRIEPTVALRYE
jgi:predicted permease